MFSDNLDYEIIDQRSSADGRIVLMNIKTFDKVCCIINVYARNCVKDRRPFFMKIEKWISEYALNINNVIVGGDFYFCEVMSIFPKVEHLNYIMTLQCFG